MNYYPHIYLNGKVFIKELQNFTADDTSAESLQCWPYTLRFIRRQPNRKANRIVSYLLNYLLKVVITVSSTNHLLV